jgi:hypothetical protein
MAYLPAAQRALDVLSPVVIYRQIGRRPSKVYVDDPMTASASRKKARHRLNDRVYWRTQAKPGDQIQDRPGGILLVTAKGECFPITLAEPSPLSPETAFTHADLAIKADQGEAARLLTAGQLIEATPRRPKARLGRPADTLFAEDHPLVVDQLPRGVSLETEPPLHGRPGSWVRRDRSPAR